MAESPDREPQPGHGDWPAWLDEDDFDGLGEESWRAAMESLAEEGPTPPDVLTLADLPDDADLPSGGDPCGVGARRRLSRLSVHGTGAAGTAAYFRQRASQFRTAQPAAGTALRVRCGFDGVSRSRGLLLKQLRASSVRIVEKKAEA